MRESGVSNLRMLAAVMRITRRGALLLECVLALAMLIIGMVLIYAILDSSRDAAEREALTQEAREVAASALALIESGHSGPESLTGPAERWRECKDRAQWQLEIDTVAITGAQPGTLQLVVKVYALQSGASEGLQEKPPIFEIAKIVTARPIDPGVRL